MDGGGGRRVGSSVEGWREGGESGQRGRSFPPKVSLSPKAAAVTLNDLRFAAPSTSGARAPYPRWVGLLNQLLFHAETAGKTLGSDLSLSLSSMDGEMHDSPTMVHKLISYLRSLAS